MSVLPGYIAASPDGGVVNPAICAMLDAYAIDNWPAHAVDAAPGRCSALASNLPVPANGQAIGGYVAASYVGDWYDRIHVVPRQLSLGNLISSQLRNVEVWNAYRDQSKTLTDVAQANTDGIVVTAPAAFPMTFQPLQSRIWTVNVTINGTPTINAALTWLFTGEAGLAVAITGQRVTGWSFTPDWTHGITETLAWLTDRQESIDGSVDRIPVRENPRRTWEFGVMAGGASRDLGRELLESAIAAWRGRVWALPVWPDQTVLGADLPAGSMSVAIDTTAFDYVAGGLAMLHASPYEYEVVEIDQVQAGSIAFTQATQNDWPVGTRIWPCRLARLSETPKYKRGSSNAMRTTVRFRADEECAWAGAAPATNYLGYPVLEQRPDETGNVVDSADRQLEELDGKVGGIYVTDPTGLPWWTQTYAWWLAGRTARADLRSLLYWLGGRAEAIWLPSFTDDVALVDTLSAGTVAMSVFNGGFSLYTNGMPGRRHVRIERLDGTIEYRAITGASKVDAFTEQLVLDSQLASELKPADVRQISFMMLAQQSTDHVEIDHMTDAESYTQGLATCRTSFVALPAEEPAA